MYIDIYSGVAAALACDQPLRCTGHHDGRTQPDVPPRALFV